MLTKVGEKAKTASRFLAAATKEEKNRALLKIADALLKNTGIILSANKADVEKAKKKRHKRRTY